MNIFEKHVSQDKLVEDNKSISNMEHRYDNSNFSNKILSQFINIYVGIMGIVFSFFGIRRKDNRKLMVIYKEIFTNQITQYINQKKEKDLLYENIFIINDKIDNDIMKKLKFKPLGIKINDSRVFVSSSNGAIFVYSDNSNFDDLVLALKDNVLLKNRIIKHINSDTNSHINFDTENIVPVKVTSNTDIDVKTENDMIVVSEKYGSYNLFNLLTAYTDIMTRQGFVVKENLFRYIDDFDKKLTKEERKKEFINILKQQITVQLIFDFDTLNQIQVDFGDEVFGELIKQLQEQNIRIYVLVSDKNKIKDIMENKFISGYILFDNVDTTNLNNEQTNGNMKCKIFDCLTCDDFEAMFVAETNSNTCSKIISILNTNILKQPLIFRNSCIKEAVIKQRDTTIYNNFKSIFSLGMIFAIVSDMKSEYSSKKFVDTYTVKDLTETFEERDVMNLLKLYKGVNLEDNLNFEAYSEIIKILRKNQSLDRFFDVSNKSKIKNLNLFIDNIIFRIMAANILKQQDKDMGLKNKKYEEILAKALKIQFINNFDDNTIDTEVLEITKITDQLLKEKTLKQYIEDNIIKLTQRAFNKEQPDSVAINTIIFLIPYAETADIIIDITNMHIKQHDLRLTKNILSAA